MRLALLALCVCGACSWQITFSQGGPASRKRPEALCPISRLVVSDIKRCVDDMSFVDGCEVVFDLDGVCTQATKLTHKANKYLTSRRPIVEWGFHRWLEHSNSALPVLSPAFNVPIVQPALSLSAALAPIQPWRVCLEAFRVAPVQTLSAGLSLLLLWLHHRLPLAIAPTWRRQRQQRALARLASAYEQLHTGEPQLPR